MCKWGNDQMVRVKVVKAATRPEGPAEPLKEPYWTEKAVDSCIAPIVEGLQKTGVWTVTSCCGHEKRTALGTIMLADGRTLYVTEIPFDRPWRLARKTILRALHWTWFGTRVKLRVVRMTLSQWWASHAKKTKEESHGGKDETDAVSKG
jgi:hypothetical protein